MSAAPNFDFAEFIERSKPIDPAPRFKSAESIEYSKPIKLACQAVSSTRGQDDLIASILIVAEKANPRRSDEGEQRTWQSQGHKTRRCADHEAKANPRTRCTAGGAYVRFDDGPVDQRVRETESRVGVADQRQKCLMSSGADDPAQKWGRERERWERLRGLRSRARETTKDWSIRADDRGGRGLASWRTGSMDGENASLAMWARGTDGTEGAVTDETRAKDCRGDEVDFIDARTEILGRREALNPNRRVKPHRVIRRHRRLRSRKSR
ncbi:hypothetical protein N7492_002165 [Penicillium capsulatum]|uniref:Uncharacterized protein n=1 Tax=Penicillium capsulatum TaxID=69766 RepID=A0A9W9II28_9EURO|nr:hypothetical protein N7492_002165 [Penicillium capsulatum]KAJ6123225.1 hypothetical protein N7512_005690 [Penicillium capsulatum]